VKQLLHQTQTNPYKVHNTYVHETQQSYGTGQQGVGEGHQQGGRYAACATRRIEDQ